MAYIVSLSSGTSHLVKRSCPRSWSEIYGRCFRYFSSCMTWAAAEKHCQFIGENLTSVHNFNQHQGIEDLIWTINLHYSKVWIGGTDAQHDGVWFWSDGSTFQYTKWCHGQFIGMNPEGDTKATQGKIPSERRRKRLLQSNLVTPVY
ncbi:galactose-specific lectin nattectin-like [Betta splendens]|uniref:Galactose-specific lectin nattectin-like n=1 Tax=Betta splendens TaxID=158456 RepID=A0A9W2XBB6_BETSP|nr:galactose-specific lectin nattectin-like [Betta splendens]